MLTDGPAVQAEHIKDQFLAYARGACLLVPQAILLLAEFQIKKLLYQMPNLMNYQKEGCD